MNRTFTPSFARRQPEERSNLTRPVFDRLEDRRLLDSSGLSGPAAAPATANVADFADGRLDLEPHILAQGVTELDIVLGDANARKVIFTDDDGTRIEIQHKNGTATVHLTGEHLEQIIGNRDIEVTGTNIQIDSIAYANTSFRSSTQIKTSKGGDGKTAVGTISGNTPVGKLVAKNVSLIGQGILMTGNGVIASVTLADVRNGADIDMPGNAPRKGHTLKFDLIEAGTDMSFVSDVHLLDADSWLDGTFSATEAHTIKVRGNASGDWTLTSGGARSIAIGGSVVSGTWNFARLTRKLTVKRSFAADSTATSYRKVKIHEDFTGSFSATATGGTSITKLSVKGASSNARVSSVADVKKLEFGEVTNLEVYVGLPADWAGGLPADLNDFARSSHVKKFTVKGTTTGPTFVADDLKKLDMRNVADSADFNLAARHVRKASMRLDGDRYTFRNDRIFSDAPSLAYLNFVQLA